MGKTGHQGTGLRLHRLNLLGPADLAQRAASDNEFLLEISYPVLDRVIVHVLQKASRLPASTSGIAFPTMSAPLTTPT